MDGGLLALWNHQSMQILVLLSLGLQFVLFILAGVRRREDAPVRRFILWLAYLMADSTAIYAVGHLSFSSIVQVHPLVTFWAPFLLLHLGGPDNITAYALQDNQLWLRHLQTLVVQVLGVAYLLLYRNMTGGNLLGLATVLMFALGVVKYGERTWALKCGTLESIGSSVKAQPPAIHNHFHPQDMAQPPAIHKHFHPQDKATDEEFLLRRAHSLFHISKRAIVDSSVIEEDTMEGHEEYTAKMMDGLELWALMEIELSLMYDLLYTKASVVHTSLGYLVRAVSPLVVAASLVLFNLTGKDGHNRDDIAITYILLGGALFMETTSLMNALGSSWTFAFLSSTKWHWLKYTALCSRRWDRLRRLVVSLHHVVKGGAASASRYESRKWSGTIGQYNMLHFCTRPANTLTSPLLGRLAKLVAPSEWWNRKHYSGTVQLSKPVKKFISTYMRRLYSKGEFNTGMLRKKWGEDPLDLLGLYEGILKESLGVEFQEGILIWHLGTDVFLAKSRTAKAEDADDLVKAIKILSNYMMFLMVDRPFMLPGQPQNRLYKRTCEKLVSMRPANPKYPTRRRNGRIKNLFSVYDGPGSSRDTEMNDLANNLYDEYVNRKLSNVAPRLTHVARLAEKLLEKERDGTADTLKLVLDVWMDILIYAGNKCSRNSHAQKLNSGGEMTTILWLMAEYLYQVSL
ncbi:hypothetical protein QYE76_038087 [Lolium multiflorum]|uniref:DUF4220 domain-containing protein n=1 Tax=Lolium multiflorum TaxID=4521 RepID=A0AAD8WQX2_LOLMU|nr:hypothetical protein QYE76_038087 [Lolium multiflorum]